MPSKNKYIKEISIKLLLALALIGAVFLAQNDRFRSIVFRVVDKAAERLFAKDYSISYGDSLDKKLADIGWKKGSEIFIRIFKKEDVLELFGKHNGKWVLLKTYDICRWSGKLGPKFFEGDRQAPEGFYAVSKKQMNPHSRHHLSFNLGFPNRVERAQGKTGSFLMVHGGCTSIGCYAITDAAVDEVYKIVDDAFAGGQKQVAVHAFPFQMNELNMEKYKSHKAHAFWQEIKPGYDKFEQEREVPKIYACNSAYCFSKSDGTAPKGGYALKGW